MATGNAINANTAGIVKYDGAGTFSATTVTQNDVIIGGASNALTSLALTNGQLAIGNTGSAPSAATLTAGTGVSISNGSGSITLNAIGGGMTWTVVTGTSQAMTSNNGYIANNSGLVTFSLPTTSSVGDVVAVTGINNATGWKITYTTNQQIFFGTSSSTLTSGNIASINTRDTVYLVCMTANLTWNVVSAVGNITVA